MQRQRFIPVVLFGLLAAAAPPAHAQTAAPATPEQVFDRVAQTEAALIAGLVPRRQALIKRPDVAKVINLHVDPASASIYEPTPLDEHDEPVGGSLPNDRAAGATSLPPM